MFPTHHPTENKEMAQKACGKPTAAQAVGGMDAPAQTFSLEDASSFTQEVGTDT